MVLDNENVFEKARKAFYFGKIALFIGCIGIFLVLFGVETKANYRPVFIIVGGVLCITGIFIELKLAVCPNCNKPITKTK